MTTLTSMNTSRPTLTGPRMSMRAGSARVTPSSISALARSARNAASSFASCTLSFTPSTSASVGEITAFTFMPARAAITITSVR